MSNKQAPTQRRKQAVLKLAAAEPGLLRGVPWLDRPVHPALTYVPLGAWLTAAVSRGLGHRSVSHHGKGRLLPAGLTFPPGAAT